MKRIGFALAAACTLALLAGGVAHAGDDWIKLFNGKNLDGWKVFLDPKKKDAGEVFTVKEGVLYCEGNVNGYVITDKEYENYTLKVEWRWGERVHVKYGRNSGVFVHVVGPDKIWPKAIEAQLMAGRAGDFWLVDNFKLDVDPKRQDPKVSRHYFRMKDDVEKKLGEWNQYEITCQGKNVKLVVNGETVNEGANAELTRGRILLQSEGAEIHFRNVMLKQLK
ncbi:MAG: DUF1080 domain-containing protein [Gemmataceae bacterium]|nr:DUF1080 domain-containing protein [Gemmataceae bacterium]MCI0737465.1 DUF1080 domain-containing protein [Gemmataceae bacterium]